jgi:hypothetical protein
LPSDPKPNDGGRDGFADFDSTAAQALARMETDCLARPEHRLRLGFSPEKEIVMRGLDYRYRDRSNTGHARSTSASVAEVAGLLAADLRWSHGRGRFLGRGERLQGVPAAAEGRRFPGAALVHHGVS